MERKREGEKKRKEDRKIDKEEKEREGGVILRNHIIQSLGPNYFQLTGLFFLLSILSSL